MKIEIGNINKATIQIIGNKALDEGVSFATYLTDLTIVESYLKELVVNSFQFEDLKRFDYIESLELNPVYNFVGKIFSDENVFVKQSNNLARLLYDQSIHPNIKSGEFYVILFKDCKFDGQTTDMLGLFKTERKDTVLAVDNDGVTIQVRPVKGANLKKLDKGCLIFNIDQEAGYVVATVDRINKSKDAHYWTENFLNVRSRIDSYHSTKHIMHLCKGFIGEELKQIDSCSSIDVINASCKSLDYLNNNTQLILNDFVDQIFDQQVIRNKFKQYTEDYQYANDLELPQCFPLSIKAIAHNSFKSLGRIKLDSNFEIKVCSDNKLIERGFDQEKGLHYYKLWFEREK